MLWIFQVGGGCLMITLGLGSFLSFSWVHHPCVDEFVCQKSWEDDLVDQGLKASIEYTTTGDGTVDTP